MNITILLKAENFDFAQYRPLNILPTILGKTLKSYLVSNTNTLILKTEKCQRPRNHHQMVGVIKREHYCEKTAESNAVYSAAQQRVL